VNLDKLLNPRTVAVVGASDDGAGGRLIDALTQSGYAGAVYPINPKRTEVRNRRCYPDVRSAPDAIDCAYVATPAAAVLSVLDDLAATRVGAAIVYATGFADAGPEGRRHQDELAARARAYDIALCGPSSLGLINGLDGFPAFIGSEGKPDAGPIAVVSQSAGFIDAIRTSGSAIQPGMLIASGNEAVLTAADYVLHLLEDARLSVIGLALEAVREPAKIRAAAQRADALGKALVVMKVGRSDRGREAAMGHTGSLVGNDRAWTAFFARHNIVRIGDLDELIETLALFGPLLADGRRVRGRGIGVIGTSGGKAGLYADVASDVGIDLPILAAATRDRLVDILGPGTPAINPVDCGVGGVNALKIERCLAALVADEAVDLAAVYGDPPVDAGRFPGYLRYCNNALAAANKASAASAKPIVFVNTRAGRWGRDVDVPRDPRVPLLNGARPALQAIDHFTRWSTAAPRWPEGVDSSVKSAALQLVRSTLPLGGDRGLVRPEAAAKLLDLYGIARIAERCVMTEADAVAAAAAVGYPVVAKLVSARALHKSDYGFVKLGLTDAAAVARAFADLWRAGARLDDANATVSIQRLAPPGVEMIAGITNDRDVGPLLVFGAGGVLVDVLRVVEQRLLPLDQDEVAALVAAGPGAALLTGVRGRPAADVDALAITLGGLGRLGWDLRSEIVEVDLNPVIVLGRGEGAWAVDARIIVRTSVDGRIEAK